MAKFKDEDGREWIVTVSLHDIRRLRDAEVCDLLKIVDNDAELFARLCEDVFFLVDVLWALLKPKAEGITVEREIVVEVDAVPGPGEVRQTVTQKVTEPYGPEEFAKAMLGQAIADGGKALFQAIADFFPSPKMRQSLMAMTNKAFQAGEMMGDHALKAINATDVKELVDGIVAMEQAEKAKTSTEPRSKSQQSPELETPSR